MRYYFTNVIFALGIGLWACAVHAQTSARPQGNAAVIASVSVTPGTAQVAKGLSKQFTATATFSNGTKANVTKTAAWTSSDPTVSTVSASGLAGGLSVGTCTITATFDGMTGSASLSITPPAVVKVQISPTTSTVTEGSVQKFTAQASYTDSSMQDVSSTASWVVSNTSIARSAITASNYIIALASGVTKVTVSIGGKSSYSTLQVNNALPLFAYTANEQESTLSGFAVDATNGGFVSLPGSKFGVSANPAAVAVDPSGSFLYSGNQDRSISGYSIGPSNGNLTPLTGSPFSSATNLDRLVMHPSGQSAYGSSLADEHALQFAIDPSVHSIAQVADLGPATVVQIDSSGRLLFLGNSSYSAPGIVGYADCSYVWIVDPDPFGGGTESQALACAGSLILPGVPIVADYSNYSDCAADVDAWNFWADQGFLDPEWCQAVYGTIQYNASVSTFQLDDEGNSGTQLGSADTSSSNGSVVDIVTDPTGKFAYSVVSDQNVVGAYGINADGSISAGTTYSTTSSNIKLAMTRTGILYVLGSAGEVSGFQVNSSDGSLVPLAGSPFSTTPHPSSILVDPTSKFVYIADSGNNTVQAFSIQPKTNALKPVRGFPQATGLSPGSLAFAAEAVKPNAKLLSIEMSPAGSFALPLGETQQVAIVGSLSDGSSEFLTNSASWTSSNIAVATVGNNTGNQTPGLVQSRVQGTSTIKASVAGLTAITSVAVQNPVALSISLSPSNVSLPVGVMQQYAATALFSNGSSMDVTDQVSWSLSSPSVAMISSGGLLTAESQGGALVTATFGAVIGTSNLVVGPPIAVVLSVTSPLAKLIIGESVQLSVIGTFTDGSKRDITGQAAWSSTGSTIGSSGLITANALGPATATATIGSLSGSISLSVFQASPKFAFILNACANLANYCPTNSASSVGIFSIDSSTGMLTSSAAGPYAANIFGGSSIVADPTGRFLYAMSGCNGNDCTQSGLTGYAVNPDTGGLSLLGSGLPTQGSQATASAVNSAGNMLFVVNSCSTSSSCSQGSVVSFNLDPVTGIATAIGSPVGSQGNTPNAIAVDPQGRFLFVLNECSTVTSCTTGSISEFAIGPSGTLSLIANSPTLGYQPQSVLLDPSGSYLYLVDDCTDSTCSGGGVEVYSVIGSSGLALVSPPVSSGGRNGEAAVIDPTGQSLLVLNRLEFCKVCPRPLIPSSIQVFSILNGQLTPLSGQTVAAGSSHISIDPSGAFVYVSSHACRNSRQCFNDVQTYVFDVSTSNLTAGSSVGDTQGAIPGVIVTTGASHSVVPSITGVYVRPQNVQTPVGLSQQLTLEASMSDGTSEFITGLATWTSSSPGTVSFESPTNSPGLATGVAQGSATVTASDPSGHLSTTFVTVTAPVLQYLTVLPSGAVLAFGQSLQFQAIGTYTDGSTQDLSSQVTWSCSSSGGIVVNSSGLAMALGDDTAIVYAALGTAQGYTTLTSTGSGLLAGRFEHQSVLLGNGEILTVGGNNGSNYLTGAELFDPVAEIGSMTGNLNDARSAPLINLASGQVLVAGGLGCGTSGCGTSLSTAELYNPAAGIFTLVGNMSTPRSGHALTLLTSGKVLVAGGAQCTAVDLCTNYTSSVELYDPTAQTFTVVGNMSTPRYGASAILLPSGRVLIAGGFDGNTMLSSAEIFDPNLGTFTVTGNLNVGRHFHSATLLNTGQVLISGGADCFNCTFTTVTELYDEGHGTFSVGPNTNVPHFNHTATLLMNGQVLLAGGLSACPSAANCTTNGSLELYDPIQNLVINAGQMTDSRELHTSTLWNTGSIFIAGGFNTNSGVVLGTTQILEMQSVTPPNLVSISINQNPSTLSAGTVLQLTATGSLTGGATQVLQSVVWNSSDTTVAAVTPGPEGGILQAIASGTTTITATAGTVTGSIVVMVEP